MVTAISTALVLKDRKTVQEQKVAFRFCIKLGQAMFTNFLNRNVPVSFRHLPTLLNLTLLEGPLASQRSPVGHKIVSCLKLKEAAKLRSTCQSAMAVVNQCEDTKSWLDERQKEYERARIPADDVEGDSSDDDA